MKKTKQTYSTPEVETLVIRFEGCLCSSPNQVRSNSSSSGYDSENDLGEFGD